MARVILHARKLLATRSIHAHLYTGEPVTSNRLTIGRRRYVGGFVDPYAHSGITLRVAPDDPHRLLEGPRFAAFPLEVVAVEGATEFLARHLIE
jgi:hypothetical protein